VTDPQPHPAPHRRITDPQALKGLTHPLRRKLYDQLSHFGPATVSTLAERVESDPGQVSYHLRELGKRGFIEEAPEYARDRRERWWRTVPGGVSWSSTAFPEASGRAVADVVFEQIVADQYERLANYNATRDSWPAEWVEVATANNSHLRLTPDELKALTDELQTVILRWAQAGKQDPAVHPDDRTQDGRANVFLFFHAFPEQP
jgi:DNA-binding transcriptional ArsR family regulator